MTTPRPEARRRFRITRDGILFVVGVSGIIYETVVHGGENPTLLILFGAMCGLPVFLRSDEMLARRAASPPEEVPSGPESQPKVAP
jgi:hypothetical protein